MIYKGHEITAKLDQSQEWSIDDEGNLVELIDSWDVGNSDTYLFTIYDADGEATLDANNLEDAKKIIDELDGE